MSFDLRFEGPSSSVKSGEFGGFRSVDLKLLSLTATPLKKTVDWSSVSL